MKVKSIRLANGVVLRGDFEISGIPSCEAHNLGHLAPLQVEEIEMDWPIESFWQKSKGPQSEQEGVKKPISNGEIVEPPERIWLCKHLFQDALIEASLEPDNDACGEYYRSDVAASMIISAILLDRKNRP